MNFHNLYQIIEAKTPRTANHIVMVKDINQVYDLLKQYSILEGGAWAWHIMPFSNEARFFKYDVPSKIPDNEIDFMRTNEYEKGAIGWKGEIIPFSKTQIIRDQNRGFSDR